MQTEQLDPVATDVADRIRDALGPNSARVLLFGSRARREGKGDSDYDFLVETHAPVTEQERDLVADVAIDMSITHHVLLDVHYRSLARMQRDRGRSLFLQTVLAEAVAV